MSETTPETPTTIAILAGGLTHERDVSLSSGRRVAAELREAGYQTKVLDVDANLLTRLDSTSPDIVWPLVHGVTGEDGALQELLDLIGLPYVGSNALSARRSSNKTISQEILRQAGVRVPRSLSLPESLVREIGVTPALALLENRFGFPLVTKPAVGGSSLGVTVVRRAGDLPRAMVDCFAYGNEAHIEEYVDGHEVCVSLVEMHGQLVALPPVEVRVSEGIYDYDARYEAGRAEYFVPAELEPEALAEVADAAKRAFTLLGMSGLARIDFIVGEQGPVLIDINVAPGMTETSLLPLAAESYAEANGEELRDVYAAIVEHALGRAGEGPEQADGEPGQE